VVGIGLCIAAIDLGAVGVDNKPSNTSDISQRYNEEADTLQLLHRADYTDPPSSQKQTSRIRPESDRAQIQSDETRHTETVSARSELDVALTFYVCVGAPAGFQDGYCGRMASGTEVHRGAAACGYAWSLGTQFTIDGDPTGLVYTCKDRGLGPAEWVDIWFYDYAEGRAWRNQFPIYVTVRFQP